MYHLDSKLLRMAASHISVPICHTFNRRLISGVCQLLWKEGNIIPLFKDAKSTFEGPNSRPIPILPVLSKLLEKIVFQQVQAFFSAKGLRTENQHAHRVSHSISTALTQMSDSWLLAIDRSMLVCAVMLDFNASFYVIDRDLLIQKLIFYGLNSLAILIFRSYPLGLRASIFMVLYQAVVG